MYANKNNLRSELTANIGVLDTSISITAGEGVLWEADTVACLEHYENDICTKREIVKITAITSDTLTVTRGFATCVMNDNTKAQGNTSQTFGIGDFLSVYLSKELWESITTGITTNQTDYATMLARLNAPKTCINSCCQSWKNAIDTAYVTKFGGNAGFGTGADGDCIIEQDTFLDASYEYNFNNLKICEGATLRFCGVGTPTINVWNDFVNCGVLDMRAPYLEARTTSQVDCWLDSGREICNQCDSLTGIASEGGLYCGGSGAGGTCSGSGASIGCGGDGGDNPGSADGCNGGDGITSGSFGTGGGGGFGIGNGGNGGNGGCSGGNGGNGFYGGQGGTKTGSGDGGGGAGGVGVVRGGDAGGGRGATDFTTMGNGGDAITNVYGLHLNARNIYNKCVNAKGGDGGNGGGYCWVGTEGGYAPSGGCGGNGANGGQMLISYENMCKEGCFDVSAGKGGKGGWIKFTSETCCRYVQPDGSDGTAGWVVFKSSRSPYVQDLMLQNNSNNQAILISWKDPRVLSWNKTIIRYSTTDYPANLTDGMLAVEETTRNQYESTPYSLNSVLDQTTYYFTAFALDSNNSIIDTETATITTDFGWQPGVNTIAYYKFDNNLSDSSGNGYNMTWNTTSSYGTTADGATYANFTGSTWTNYLNGFPYDPSAYTVSFWMNYPAYSSGGAGVILDYLYSDGSQIPLRIQDKGSQLNIGGVTLTPSTNTRHQYTISYSSGTATIYVDGSSTGQTFIALAAGTARLIFGNEGASSYNSYHAGRGMISEFIIEGKTRSAQDISDYYNQTKGNYGL